MYNVEFKSTSKTPHLQVVVRGDAMPYIFTNDDQIQEVKDAIKNGISPKNFDRKYWEQQISDPINLDLIDFKDGEEIEITSI